jgi:hypothetical protein
MWYIESKKYTFRTKTYLHVFADLGHNLLNIYLKMETKSTVSMFIVCLKINTTAMDNKWAIRLHPPTVRNFTEDMAETQHGMCELARHGTAVMCELAVTYESLLKEKHLDM